MPICRRQQAWQKQSKQKINPKPNLNLNADPKPNSKACTLKSFEKSKKNKREVAKVRVKPKSIAYHTWSITTTLRAVR